MRRLARHTFTAAAGLSLMLLLAWGALWLDRKGTTHTAGRITAWANEANVLVGYYGHQQPWDDWEWQPIGMSIGVVSLADRDVRLCYVQVPHQLACSVLLPLPLAWVVTRLVRRRKGTPPGFDVQPIGAGCGLSTRGVAP